MIRIALTTIAATVTAVAFLSAPATAQNFPSKPIKMLVGFPAGGPSDVPARIIADKLQKSLGQPVVVENKTGAAGMIAMNEMLAQPRDGHTLLLCSYIDPANTLLYKKVTYKVEDMAAVSLVTKAYYAFVVPAESPASNAKEFVALAKEKNGGLNYGKVGTGSVTELLPKQVEKLTGAKMTGVTFRGTGPAMQEIVGNRLDFAVSPISITIPFYEEKKIKVIGFTSPERLAVAPNVPTLAEQGLAIVNYGWWGVCAASGVPKPVLETLNKHVRDAVASEEFKTIMEKAGTIPTASTVDEFTALIAATAKEAGDMFRELDIPQLD